MPAGCGRNPRPSIYCQLLAGIAVVFLFDLALGCGEEAPEISPEESEAVVRIGESAATDLMLRLSRCDRAPRLSRPLRSGTGWPATPMTTLDTGSGCNRAFRRWGRPPWTRR